MTKKNILNFCILALSLLLFSATISVYAEEDCSEALIRALKEEGLSEQKIETICKKLRIYSDPEVKQYKTSDFTPYRDPDIELSPIEETALTIVEALINADDEVLRKLYSPNNRFFLRNLNRYYEEFNSTESDDYDFDTEGNVVTITRYSDRDIKFRLHMVNKGNDEYLWEEIRRTSIAKPKKKSLLDVFFD